MSVATSNASEQEEIDTQKNIDDNVNINDSDSGTEDQTQSSSTMNDIIIVANNEKTSKDHPPNFSTMIEPESLKSPLVSSVQQISFLCSMSPPFSSQHSDHNNFYTIQPCDPSNSNQYYDFNDFSEVKINNNLNHKKLSFSSTASVSDSGNESFIDEEFPTPNNHKILNYFAEDDSKTVKLAKRRLTKATIPLTFKLDDDDDNDIEENVDLNRDDDFRYDSDDESTLFETSLTSSPTEYGTPKAYEGVDFKSVCNSIENKRLGQDLSEEEKLNKPKSLDGRKLKDDQLKEDLLKKFDENKIIDEFCDTDEDLDENDDLRCSSVLIRSTSLKTGKTPPGTPGCGTKKIVRFADAMGLDLASIRHIVDDVPYAPPITAFKGLQLDEEDRDWLFENYSNHKPKSKTQSSAKTIPTNKEIKTCMKILFPQPSSDPVRFMDRVRSNKVSLENCLVSGPNDSGQTFTISCIIRVLNICFHKKVSLRYTINEWLTWKEVPGVYVPNSNDEFSDKFSVKLDISVNRNGHQTMMPGQRLLFAIRYFADERDEYWDNNSGLNYALIYQRC
ncbi:hypothetical protein SSS_07198 [Sarcoptes scabiei]|uniref:Glycogen-binding subunit 76A n=1 Tax=Sarcoptes scabiei TaxID=52283 RepID=A0A834RAT5_SARSC|nr:hypothetical protein SSS_07198 [Sarcoptes scabiei]